MIQTNRGEVLSRITIENGKVIFHEGDDSTDMFILESGRVGFFKDVKGKQVQLATLEKGAVFGEMAAITGERRSATMKTLETSVIVRISKSTIQSKLRSCDPFIKALIEILINNLNRVNERFAVKNTVVDKLIGELKAGAK
ncbi:MAG: cyclic nucleotide-binding domain-containing protein [Rhodobacteraceae bacterium]|nr:cyclic nucleotide-binding domain-containing protein [Paracoccaceae bacterium]